MKKTKIIATIGPSCTNQNKIKNMIIEGMNVARINMSHQYDLDDLKNVIQTIRDQSELLD